MALTEQPVTPAGGLVLPGTPGFRTLPGTEALVRDPNLQAQVVRQQGEQMLRNMERAAMLSGEIERNFTATMENTRHAREEAQRIATEVSTGAVRLPPAEVGGGGVDPNRGGLPEPGAGPASQTPIEPPYPQAELPEAPTAITAMTYEKARGMGSSLKSLEAHAAQRMNRFVSERGGRYTQLNAGDVVDTESGRVAAAAGTPEAEQLVAQDPRRFAPAEEGQILDTAHRGQRALLAPDDPEHGTAVRSLARLGMAKTGLETLAGGGGVKGLLGSVTKVAGPVGVAVGAVAAADAFIGKQREENLFYQQATGATQAEAFVERGRETLAGFAESPIFGGIGRERAREQFREVTQMGITGDQREEALGFMSDAFKQWGLDTSDSLKVVQEVTSDASLSFEGLSGQLATVGEEAVKAGGNMQEAQRQFLANLEEIQATVGGGAGAAQLAAITAGQQAQFANTAVAGVSNVGALGQQANLFYAAQQMGVSPFELEMGIAQEGRMAERYHNLTDAGFLERLGIPPQTQQEWGDFLIERFPDEAVPSQTQAMEALQELGFVDYDSATIVQAAQQHGITGVTEENAFIEVVVRLMKQRRVKVTPGKKATTPGNTRTGRTPTGDKIIKGKPGLFGPEGMREGASLERNLDMIRQQGTTAAALGWENTAKGLTSEERRAEDSSPGGIVGGAGDLMDDQKAPPAEVNAYLDWSSRTGKRNLAVEQLLKPKTYERLGDARFQVEGVKGTVGMEQLVTKYGKQVAAGDVEAFRKTEAGKLSGIGQIEEFTKGAVERGERERQQERGGGEAEQGRTKVEVALSPFARRFLEVITTEGNLPSESQRSGTPASGRRNPRQYPAVQGQPTGDTTATWGS